MAVKEFLDSPDAETTIRALSLSTKDMLSHLLNPMKVIRNHQSLPRNWEGLASLCGIDTSFLPSILNETDRTGKVLRMWEKRDDKASLGQLITYLEELDRTDVVDDILPLIAKDIEKFNQHKSGTLTSNVNNNSNDLLTSDDARMTNLGLDLTHYDAYVLFDDEDVDFAATVVTTLRDPPYNLSLCTKQDLLAGVAEINAIGTIMEHRTVKIISILSKKFVDSDTCQFLFSMAQNIALAGKKRKLIPVTYKGEDGKDLIKLPPWMNVYAKLDYRFHLAPMYGSFWDRMFDNIKAPEVVPSVPSKQPRAIKLATPEPRPLIATPSPDARLSHSLNNLPSVPTDDPIVLSSATSDTNMPTQSGTMESDSRETNVAPSKSKRTFLNKYISPFQKLSMRSKSEQTLPAQSEKTSGIVQTAGNDQENIANKSEKKKLQKFFTIPKKWKAKKKEKTAVAVAS